MHTWVRRGLRTALVTGGLLMLGTSIASADESFNPDLPPGPVDVGPQAPAAAAPVHPVRPYAQQFARRRGADRYGTVSGTFTADQMANRWSADSTADPNGFRDSAAHGPLVQRSPSLPGNGALSMPVAPSMKDVGLADEPKARSVPTAQGALPSAPAASSVPAVPSVPQVISGVTSQLPLANGVGAPNPITSTRQATQPTPGTQDTETLNRSPLELLPTPSVPSAPNVPLTPMAQAVDQLMSHLQVHPSEAPNSTDHVVRDLRNSPLGAQPGVPDVPTLPDASPDAFLAPATPGIAGMVPVPQAATVPPSTTATKASPAPDVDVLGILSKSVLGSLPGGSAVKPLLSKLPATPLTGAPTPARQGTGGSLLPTGSLAGSPARPNTKSSTPLPVAQAAEVSPSGATPATGPNALGALPGVPDLAGAKALADKLGSASPMFRGALVPLSMAATMATSLAQQTAQSAGKSSPDALPGVSTVTAAPKAMPDVTGFAAPVRRGVNDSPLGALPGVPNMPALPTTGRLLYDVADVATAPGHVTRVTELPGSDLNPSNLPTTPVESMSDSRLGTMLGVPTVRDAVVRSAGVPVDRLDQVPGTVSRGINTSPFATLPGHPTVPTAPSLPEVAARTADQPLVSTVTDSAAGAVRTSQVFGKPAAALPGLSDTKSIAGLLPVVRDLFPRI